MDNPAKGFSQTTGKLKQGCNSSHDNEVVQRSKPCKLRGRSGGKKILVSKLKRLGQLNALRSLVPNATKQDKVSIVSNAISHVENLKKQAEEIRLEIAALQSNLNRHTDPSLLHSSTPNTSILGTNSAEKRTCKTLEVDVSKVGERSFYLRMCWKKEAGVLLQLTKALESLHLDLHNENLTSLKGHMIKTVIIKMKTHDETTDAQVLKQVVVEAASQYGFERGNLCADP
eukprot:Gb_26393 [translate_table: standard]